MTKEKKFSWWTYTLMTLVAIAVTWTVHEFSHWLAGTLLGNEMGMTLNTTYPVNGKYAGDNDGLIVDAAGPAATLLQAVVFYLLLRRGGSLMLFPFLFACFYMRLLAMGISFMNPNDEARISRAMGWGTFTLPVLVSLLLLYLVYKAVKAKKITAFQVTVTTLLVMIFSSVIILCDNS